MLVGQLSMWVSSPSTFSIKHALSNAYGVQDTDARESVYQSLKVPGSIYCLRACDDDIRCQSINHVLHGEICELNNRTKEARPEAFTTDDTKVYVKKFRKRGGWHRFSYNLVSLFSRIKPGFQIAYSMKAVVMVTFCFRPVGLERKTKTW